MNSDLVVRIAADYAMIPIVLIGAYALVFKVPRGERLQAYSRVVVAGLTAYLFAKLIGAIYQPAGLRPFEVAGKAAGASFLNNPGFPSDHTLFATAILAAVWFETKQKLIAGIILALIFVVSIGRVVALVHTPIDVIGGIVIALLGSLWYINSR